MEIRSVMVSCYLINTKRLDIMLIGKYVTSRCAKRRRAGAGAGAGCTGDSAAAARGRASPARRAARALAVAAQGQWHASLPLAHRNSIFKSRPQKNGGRLHSADAPYVRRINKTCVRFFCLFFPSIVSSTRSGSRESSARLYRFDLNYSRYTREISVGEYLEVMKDLCSGNSVLTDLILTLLTM